MRDKINRAPSGHLRYSVCRYGELIEEFSEENLIVNGYDDVVAKLLGNASGASPVTQIGVGTNGTPPIPGNAVLSGLALKGVDSISQPASGQIQFNFSLGASDFNGISISEFGLYTASGVLVARRVRPSPLIKTSSVTVTNGAWVIII